MLLSNPSTTRGLPKNPRLQSRSAAPSQADSNHHDSRSRPPPRRYANVRSGFSSSLAGAPSFSNAASFSIDDQRRGDRVSSSSPRTSLQDSLESEGTKPSTHNGKRLDVVDESAGGYTSWIGGYVASAAKTLTVNATKAWTTHMTTYDGEETPIGQESRLTRAMRAYHLGKARETSDLPTWLFGESERASLSPSRENGQPVVPEDPILPKTSNSADGRPTTSDRGTSKAAERLRSMHNTKRSDTSGPNLKGTGSRERPIVINPPLDRVGWGDGSKKPTEIGLPRQRNGLPSGPQRKRVAGI